MICRPSAESARNANGTFGASASVNRRDVRTRYTFTVGLVSDTTTFVTSYGQFETRTAVTAWEANPFPVDAPMPK